VTDIPISPRPTTEVGVLRAAARLIVANGLHQGDYLPDPFDRRSRTPHASRPMCMAAAIRCVVSGDPHLMTDVSERVITLLAARLLVNGEGPYASDSRAAEFHLAKWGDVEGRTVEAVVSVLEAAADAVAVAL
jgi:hypothetical protein